MQLAFDNAMAHQIQAGSDMFLMPSRFEPCGLTQMYALKYGTAPVVRATGGLADTVTEFDPARGTGNGFVFDEYRADAMVDAIARARRLFADRAAWRRLMDNCFAADFSWTVSGAALPAMVRRSAWRARQLIRSRADSAKDIVPRHPKRKPWFTPTAPAWAIREARRMGRRNRHTQRNASA